MEVEIFDLSVVILAVEQESYSIDLLSDQIFSLQKNIKDTEFSLVAISKCDKEKIKKTLITMCEPNDIDIIILTGKITMFSMLSDAANKIIDNDIPNEINELISNLTEQLQCSFSRLLCGIRHQTLIITACDFYPNITLIFKKHQTFIRYTIDLMAEYEETRNSKSNDNSETFNSDSDMTSPLIEYEMEKMMKFFKKSEKNIMMSVEQAIDLIRVIVHKDKYFKINIQHVNIIDAYNRVLAVDVFNKTDCPSYTTSAKHGYAMFTSNGTCGKDVRKVLKAHPVVRLAKFNNPMNDGSHHFVDIWFADISVVPGICVRVRSGDPIPKGANTVVTPENIKILDCNDNDDYFNIDDKEYEIEILVAPKVNENIRNAGYLIKRNEHVMKPFKRIGSLELGILKLCDLNTVPVIKVFSIGVFSIRSSVEESENTLGRIYKSNRIILTSLLKENGYNLTDFGISAYQLDAIIKKIEDALDKVDILVIMGSMNDKDILKIILKERFHADIHFGCLNMKPGKSTMFASCTYNYKSKFFLCMSTNPATVPIVAHVVLLPLLNTIHRDHSKPIIIQTCTKNHELHLRPKFSWTTAQWMKDEIFPRAYCSKNQHQNIMKYQKANALLRLPKYTSEVPKLDAAFVSTMFFG